jgi:hypothetical protein
MSLLNSPGNSYDGAFTANGKMPRRGGLAAGKVGVLRLHMEPASRLSCSAQDDNAIEDGCGAPVQSKILRFPCRRVTSVPVWLAAPAHVLLYCF